MGNATSHSINGKIAALINAAHVFPLLGTKKLSLFFPCLVFTNRAVMRTIVWRSHALVVNRSLILKIDYQF